MVPSSETSLSLSIDVIHSQVMKMRSLRQHHEDIFITWNPIQSIIDSDRHISDDEKGGDSIIRNIQIAINRLNRFPSNEEVFNEAATVSQNALNNRGYNQYTNIFSAHTTQQKERQ